MSDVVKAEGLVLAYNVNGYIYPLACAKDSSISVTREFLELAPKTNSTFKRYIPTKKTFTISGSGLVKLSQSNQHDIDFFDDMFETINTQYTAYLEIIDNENTYKVYEFDCYITDISLDSSVNNFGQYSYTLQGDGGFTEITTTDLEIVSSGLISGRNPANWKLVSVGYGGKWYYNYTVLTISGSYYLDMTPALNGVPIRVVYIPI
jgi:hypothetical protein